MQTVERFLRLALPLAAKSDSYVVCAIIETAIDLAVTRLAALQARSNPHTFVAID